MTNRGPIEVVGGDIAVVRLLDLGKHFFSFKNKKNILGLLLTFLRIGATADKS